MYSRSGDNVQPFTGFGVSLECVDTGEGKYGGIRGYIPLNGERLQLKGKFNNLADCHRLHEELQKSFIKGEFLAGNKRVTTLIIGGKRHYYYSTAELLFYVVFLSFFAWGLSRKLVLRLVKFDS